MNVRKDIQAKADELGAEIEIWADSENSYVIEALAPDGMEWEATGSVSLVGRWWTYDKGGKTKELNDLLERMSKGVISETN